MSRKVVVAFEFPGALEAWEKGTQKPVFDELAKKYDLDVKVVHDASFLRDCDEPSAAILRVERGGAEWAEYDEEYLDELKDAEILVVGFAPVGTKILDAAPNLKVVAVMRSGVENVNVEACKERGVIVCNAPGRLQETVSDLSCALILDINRAVTYVNRETDKNGGVDARPYFHPELFKDLTIGIFGFGIIGQLVCKKLAGFNMKFLAYDPFVTQETADKLGLGVKMVDAETLFKESDTVSVHARYLPGVNDKVISKELIDSMKPTAFFVNTARAGLEDEPALIAAVLEERIAGAALDVTMDEPVPADSPLRSSNHFILTPHMAGGAGDGQKISAEIICNQLSQYLDGGRPSSAR